MYEKYLKEARSLYERIVYLYDKNKKKCKTKAELYKLIAKVLDVPLMEVESAIALLERNFPVVYKERSADLLFPNLEMYIHAKSIKDKESVDIMMNMFKKELNITQNTILKYIKIATFQAALGVLETKISEIKEDVSDENKLEESVKQDITETEEGTSSDEPISVETGDLDVLRKELVHELLNGACFKCEIRESRLDRFISSIKKFFSGK
jgi:hypothetical protein